MYRTYVDVDGPRPEDEALIAFALDTAKSTREVEDEGAIDFVARIWACARSTDPARAPKRSTSLRASSRRPVR
ncbi:MAG: hypothetical protein R3D30_10240 [Hyphomicrobiales bacterium]